MQTLRDIITSLLATGGVMAFVIPYITGTFDRMFVKFYRKIRRARRGRFTTTTWEIAVETIDNAFSDKCGEAID